MVQHHSKIEDSSAGTIAAMTAGGLLLVAMLVLLLAMRPATVIRTEPLALPTAVILTPTQAPAANQAQPTPAAAAASDGILLLDRAIVAYATPGGDVLGAIEPGRRYRVISVALGADGVRWTQLLAEGSGSIWTKDLRSVTTTQAARQAP